jgi:hypothetical protein
MASGWFNSSTQGFIRWLGFDKEELEEVWHEAVTEGTFLAPGGGAEQVHLLSSLLPLFHPPQIRPSFILAIQTKSKTETPHRD